MRIHRGTPNHPSARGWRVGAIALLAAIVATLFPGGGVGARAATTALRAGLGHRVGGGDFVGYYVAGGQKVYCLSPTKAVPHSVALTAVSRYPGASTATSRALAFALSRWGNARSAAEAAIESQVLNTLAGNGRDVHRRSRSLPASMARSVAAHVAQARTLSGPYRAAVVLPALTPGRSATGSVAVRSGSGHAMAGVLVRLTGSANVAVPAQVRTDARGNARFTVAVTDVGEVKVVATALDLPAAGLRISHPRSREQQMVSWSAQTSARAAASFRAALGGFTNRYACTTACDGRPAVTLAACAPASRYASRLVFRLGTAVLTMNFAPAATRSCRSTSVPLGDRTRVGAAWQYRTPHGWSTPVAAPGTFVVDCPPAPPVAVSMTYDCAHAAVTFAIATAGATGAWTPTVNTSGHRYVLVVGGAHPQQVIAAPGRTAVITATTACGSHLTYTVRSGVQRARGGYNYGHLATVVTP